VAIDVKDIREDFQADDAEWEEPRRDGDKDMLCVAGKVWDAMNPEGKALRDEFKRPCISPDELSQYTNAAINNLLANKRGIKVSPVGAGADDKSAEYRQNRIRQIEYRSNAQQAYLGGFGDTIQRGYGFWRISARYEGPDTDDQELVILPIYNPNLVTVDAFSQRPDGADMRRCTIREPWRWSDFKASFPRADVREFSSDLSSEAPGWITEQGLMLAEQWRIETTSRTKLKWQRKGQDGQDEAAEAWEDELLKQDRPKDNYRKRKHETNRVRMYLTNGIEILEETDWPGQWIPVVCCFGKILYLKEGGQTKRHLMSLIRLARDPAMAHAYVWSCEVETIGAVPRTQWVGYEGQFVGHENDWKRAAHEPVAYLEVKPVLDTVSGQVLPLPTKQSWDPPLQNLAISKEGARRAIQSAIGSNFLPTQAQKQNEKSGVALKEIDRQTSIGTFHFKDHFEMALIRTGAILDDLLPHYDDTARDVTVRLPDDTTQIQRINDPNDPKSIDVTKGRHDITISTGPQADSEREEASAFADTLAQISPEVFALLGPMIVKLKNLGPVGDEIADLLKMLQPSEVRQMEAQKTGKMDPQMVMQELQASKGKLQQLQQALTEAQKVIQSDQVKTGAELEKEKLKAAANERLQIRLKEMDNACSIRVAEINAAVKGYLDERGHQAAHEEQALGAAVDAAEADRARQHEQEMADRQHQQALEQAAQGQAYTLQQGDQSHAQALQQGEQQHQQALEQGKQATESQMALQAAKPEPQPGASA
jgi:hypothetical protein